MHKIAAELRLEASGELVAQTRPYSLIILVLQYRKYIFEVQQR